MDSRRAGGEVSALLGSKLCSQEHFGAPWYLEWCGRMAEPAKLHRKQWEFCYITQVLAEQGMLQPGRRGLGFGVGQEPLPALFAAFGCEIVATDVEQEVAEAWGWAQTGQHTDNLEVLNDRGLCSQDEFRRLVSIRTVNMNDIPDDLRDFDFVWSACSLEHIGSLAHGMRFVENAMHCLRPGGIAVHTTEYNLTSNVETIEVENLSLYRRRDIEELVRMLQAEGHSIEVDLTEGTAPADRFVDLPPYLSLPHLRLDLGGYTTTSLGLIVEKGTGVFSVPDLPHRTEAPSPSPEMTEALPPGPTMEEAEARRLIKEAYLRILSREPDPWAEANLVPAVQQGMTHEALTTLLVDSEEFAFRSRFTGQLVELNGEITISLKGCEPHFGPLRFVGPSSDDLVFPHMVRTNGIWEPHVTNVLAHLLMPGDTFLDVGSNLGYYAVVAGARVGSGGTVLAFEPQTVMRRYCEANVRLNGLTNVKVLPYALWDGPDTRTIWTSENQPGGAFLIPPDNPAFDEYPREDVGCVALDDLLASVEITVPDCHFIKLDIQGSEPFALRGMRRLIGRTRPIIFCELHSGCLELGGCTPRDLLQLLDDLGYTCALLPREGEGDAFPDLANISPWPDTDIRPVAGVDRFVEIIAELDRRYPPSYTADLLIFPGEIGLNPSGLARAAAASHARTAVPRPADLAAQVAAIHWFHQIDLGHGIVTPGADASAMKLQWLQMPEDLRGMSVLDIGTWDGYFAFEAERRGAKRVLATDSFVWGPGTPGSKEGFLLAHRVLGSHIEHLEVDVMDLDPGKIGTFDLVLCLGVLYHMRHPLLALERVAGVTGRQLILETHVDALAARRPTAAFYPGAELNRDATNWWGPNPAAVEGMLRAAGFSEVRLVWSSFEDLPPAEQDDSGPLVSHRAVFHAFK